MSLEKPDLPWIISDPSIMVGKPCVRGTRVTVEAIMRRIAEGLTAHQIRTDYPHVPDAAIQAAIDFDAAGRKE